jgi:hypothetical protein
MSIGAARAVRSTAAVATGFPFVTLNCFKVHFSAVASLSKMDAETSSA